MVSSALKPHYAARTVSKEQYIEINKRISRRMYERVCGGKMDDAVTTMATKATVEVDVDLGDERERARWERVASDEVQVAVELLAAATATAGGR